MVKRTLVFCWKKTADGAVIDQQMAALWSSSFEMVRIVNHEYGQTKSLAVQVETICFVSSGRTGTKQMFDPRVAETKITKRDLASGDRRPVWSVATTAVRICYRFTTSLSVFVLFFFLLATRPAGRSSCLAVGRFALFRELIGVELPFQK